MEQGPFALNKPVTISAAIVPQGTNANAGTERNGPTH